MTRTLSSKRLAVATITVAALSVAGVFGAIRWTGTPGDVPMPFAYQAESAEPSKAAGDLAALVPNATASVFDLQVPGIDRPVARAQVLTLPDEGDVIVGWQSAVGEPVLRSDISAEEELALISALRKYLPEGSTILAMPATSARLLHFVEAGFPLASAVGQETLRVPAPWVGQEDQVTTLEMRWLADPADKTGLFSDFADALLAEDVYGSARLLTLAQPDDSYIILHVRDVFDLGVSIPDRLLVGLRDFPAAGMAHDKSRAVKDWVTTEGHAAYAVERRESGMIRAYFLSEAKDKSTLLGQLLPFNTANIGQVAGTTLVFQTGGYWVYRLQSVTDQT